MQDDIALPKGKNVGNAEESELAFEHFFDRYWDGYFEIVRIIVYRVIYNCRPNQSSPVGHSLGDERGLARELNPGICPNYFLLN